MWLNIGVFMPAILAMIGVVVTMALTGAGTDKSSTFDREPAAQPAPHGKAANPND